MEWGKDKVNMWMVDEGGREEFGEFGEKVGVKYMGGRSDEDGKGGKMKNGVKYGKGELVWILEWEEVGRGWLLEMRMGWLVKEKEVGMMERGEELL